MSFALGLDPSVFASSIDKAAVRLAGFLSVGKAVDVMVRGLSNAIHEGGALADLANETQQSAGALYSLQEAFKVVGAESGSLPMVIKNVQKALAGVDEAGEKTDKLFQAMGLNMEELRGKDAATQIITISKALNTLSQEQAQFASGKIFGRGGSGTGLRIARDVDGFREAIRAVAPEARVIDRTAATFDKIGDTIGLLKSKSRGMFAGIAEGLAPAIQQILDATDSIDTVAIGQKIGTALAGINGAFRDGKLTELIATSVSAGFEIAIDLLPGMFQKIGVLIIKVFEYPLKAISAIIDMAVQGIVGLLGKIPGANKLLGLQAYQVQTPGELWAQHMNEPLALGGVTTDEINQSANDTLKAGVAAAKQRLSELGKTFEGFADGVLATDRKTKNGKATNDISGVLQTAEKKSRELRTADVTNVEKLGFIFNRGGANNAANDHARATSENTRIANGFLKTIAGRLINRPELNFSNIA